MPKFNKRRMNSRILYILKQVGQVVACYQQTSGFANEAANRVPTDPYADNEAPPEVDYQVFYIFAQFEQDEPESLEQVGAISTVTGTLTIPWIYKSYLAKTAYFDPYLNGSRFVKVGAGVDDESVIVVQRVKSIYLPQSPGV